jgi:hypothetical protein
MRKCWEYTNDAQNFAWAYVVATGLMIIELSRSSLTSVIAAIATSDDHGINQNVTADTTSEAVSKTENAANATTKV